ncbi:MAG: Hsp20/alpha crystallin family protein [Bdellovibrionota bacterium]
MRNNNSLISRNYYGSGIPSLFQDFFRDLGDGWDKSLTPSLTTDFVPSLNISETETAYKVVAELPGMEEKDFDVTIEDNILRIKGEKKAESENKDEHYHRYEASYGSFERVLRLPEAIDSDASKASFKNGVLTLEIPKNKEVSKVKKLKIASS